LASGKWLAVWIGVVSKRSVPRVRAGRSARRSGGLTSFAPSRNSRKRNWRRRLAGAARGERDGLLGDSRRDARRGPGTGIVAWLKWCDVVRETTGNTNVGLTGAPVFDPAVIRPDGGCNPAVARPAFSGSDSALIVKKNIHLRL